MQAYIEEKGLRFYGKGSEKSRVIFEDKKMGLDQLPVAGLQLSGREAKSDPIFNIPHDSAHVNKNIQENVTSQQEQSSLAKTGRMYAEEQNAHKAVHDLATIEQRKLNHLLSDVANELDLDFVPTAQKSLKSMSDKVGRKNTSSSPYSVMDMKDHTKGKLDLRNHDQIPDVLKALDRRGIPYTTEAIHTKWGYKGFHVTFRNADGIGSEIHEA